MYIDIQAINKFGRGAPFKSCIDSWSVIIDSKNITTIEDYKKYSFMYSNSTKNGKVQNGKVQNGKVQIRKMCKTAAEQSKEKYKQIDIDKLAETNLKKEYTIEELLIEHKKLSATGQSAQLDETEKKLLEGTITVKVEEYKNFFGKSTTSILWIINKDDKQLPINEGDPECQPEKK